MAKTEVFLTIMLGFIWISLILMTLIIGVTDLIYKKRNFRIPSKILLILTLAFIISLPIRKNDWDTKRKKCEVLISHLENIRIKEGRYPPSIAKRLLKYDEIQYSIDSLGQSYILSYSIDGWHREQYSSKTKEWLGYE
ncbi:hypothetical protein [Flammeovirga sp. EKP202]|uniref:hypothetical protein n=1 Tax=Flammeovirga sp. EKP202 TaxID=2770592 RepID=UPI00165F3AD6|nr:hypothetical protein [Flammeovirga sp. EKP202]MBD0404935.1 hypothetical protein [Flammeovirga sp. EKP202]